VDGWMDSAPQRSTRKELDFLFLAERVQISFFSHSLAHHHGAASKEQSTRRNGKKKKKKKKSKKNHFFLFIIILFFLNRQANAQRGLVTARAQQSAGWA
jgi:hypothetical protein